MWLGWKYWICLVEIIDDCVISEEEEELEEEEEDLEEDRKFIKEEESEVLKFLELLFVFVLVFMEGLFL